MKRKVFEAVKLKSGEMATILNVDNDKYKVEVVGENGVSIIIINNDNIKATIQY